MKHIKEYLDIFLVLRFSMWSCPWFCFSKSEKIRLQCICQNVPRICLFVAELKTLGWDAFLPYPINLPLSSSASLCILLCHHLSLLLTPDLCLSQLHISFHHLPASLTLTVCLFSVTLVPRISPGFSLQQFPQSKQFCTSYEYSYTSKFSITSKRKKSLFYFYKYEVTALDEISNDFQFLSCHPGFLWA